ncbi:helix-turn-helix domain-containing protein [Serratia microhaemolytica]|uniref:helix-turn-helix domain-containing protein n=1 Tax=Serratia microhaemolytica TaxID=2675110 RepID=UPI000FDD6AB1|nr:helix-turn-helix transcriptional regulator [Serratia microhaemolytica]
MVMLTRQQLQAMARNDENFFKELGARIAKSRKELNLTQSQLAEKLGIAQQTMAHYEGGKLRMPASFLPELAEILNLSLDELLGLSVSKKTNKRGPTSRLEQQMQLISQLPKMKQKFVSEMLDTIIGNSDG